MPKMLLIDLCTDHPRSCGANVSDQRENTVQDGSSPLVRGQLEPADDERVRKRIIPARAGPTESVLQCDFLTTDHPRSCGANADTDYSNNERAGSSPLVRGQHRVPTRGRARTRIIPARAGPTSRCWASGSATADHPRSCGANSVDDAVGHFMSGSSPLVRGQRAVPRFHAPPRRIIPARAGPTRRR